MTARMQAGKVGGSDSPQRANMGRKRTRPAFKRDTPRHRFVHHLHDITPDSVTFQMIADAIGVAKITVAKWYSGDNLPDLDYWPKLAKVLGLADYRDLLPPR